MAQSPDAFVRRHDYRPSGWLVDETRLEFFLAPESTRVKTHIIFRPHDALKRGPEDLPLNGKELKLIDASIDGFSLDQSLLQEAENGLTLTRDQLPNRPFEWRSEVEINPQSNSSLDGLYMSKGMYCTQCEPEGFRRICHFLDRPDILSKFSVRIHAPSHPVLLSNGNLINSAEGFAEWYDPWPKPSYLFALVAGDLVAIEDRFKTMGGRDVLLRIWVRPGDDENRCDYAMDALKRSMKWDEENYGREYDLDQFNIVAVDDFNMGAMENKSLNIFNSQLVLASPETATDTDYENIESVIAHEYFHNWTGNRITCRDWFQLSLKEGLTVFRDQQFSADMRSRDVMRIQDTRRLRASQFREDDGPLAHPVRPDTYREISNFYTATVYNKGAELISMLHLMVGSGGYRKALDLYFDRHDGEACTVEDWIRAFEDSLDIDLTQFKTWYSQSGTPKVSYQTTFQNNELRLTLSQQTDPTPDQPDKQPLVIPILTVLFDEKGKEVAEEKLLLLTQSEQTFTFPNLKKSPRISILRRFSAPIILTTTPSDDDALFALRYETDTFRRWDAGQQLLLKSLKDSIIQDSEPDQNIVSALVELVRDKALDPAFRALMLALPLEIEVRQKLASEGYVVDPKKFFDACETLYDQLAQHLESEAVNQFQHHVRPSSYSPDSGAAGQRSLLLALLRLLCRRDGGQQAEQVYRLADNMTEKIGALRALLAIRKGRDQLDDFYHIWSHDRLVLDKWFSFQILEAHPSEAVELTRRLTQHDDFDWTNPNRFRSVIGAFAMGNHAGFHTQDGSGYKLLADWLIRLDSKNAQLAARHCAAFESWRLYDEARQTLMVDQLKRMRGIESVSSDSREMLDRLLQDA